jgi:hypothetical protein
LIVHRVFPLDAGARPSEVAGALWWPRSLQGSARHDNPDRYACMYVSEVEVSTIAEALAPFRSTGPLTSDLLVRGGLPLAVASLRLGDDAQLVDLDDPETLVRERLRPSRVATRRRGVTQADAAELFDRHPEAAGLRWWSTLESSWLNVTLFDRVSAAGFELTDTRVLSTTDDAVREAASLLGLG